MSWDQIWSYLDGNFSAALFGAIAGAVGAQWLGDRTEKRKALIEELRSTNAAINVTYTIANTYCNLKNQHGRPMKQRFDDLRRALDDFKKARKEGNIGKDVLFRFDADFEALIPPYVPVDTLKTLLFEKVTLTGRPLSFVVFLVQSIGDLNASIELRNDMIKECQAKSPIPEDELAPLYFGLRNKHGHIDRRFASSLENLVTKLDDSIFLSTKIVADLETHGKAIKKALGNKKASVTTIDFTKAKEQGLVPDDAAYKDWMSLPNPASQ
jgi:hypothetical protein